MIVPSSIYSNYPRNEVCPCGSNKKAKLCCLKSPGEWNKFPSIIIPTGEPTAIQNAKCYAHQTDNCCEKISKEHYISKNVLEIVNNHRGVVPIEGLPWLPDGESRVIATSNLVSKILCKRHNEALSPIDSAAGRLISSIGAYDKDFNNLYPKEEITVLSGEDIEFWMLKTTCGMVSAGNLMNNSRPLNTSINDLWIDILYGREKWPEHWGLYVSNEKIHHSKSFSFIPRTNPANDELKAVVMGINNFQFYLLLGRPDDLKAWGTYRPRTLIFTQKSIKKYIELSWQNKSNNNYVLFERVGTYDGPPPNWI